MLNPSRDRNASVKARTAVGRGEESLLCYPGSEIWKGRSWRKRRCKYHYLGWENKNSKVHQCGRSAWFVTFRKLQATQEQPVFVFAVDIRRHSCRSSWSWGHTVTPACTPGIVSHFGRPHYVQHCFLLLMYRLVQVEYHEIVKSRESTPCLGDIFSIFAHVFLWAPGNRQTNYVFVFSPNIWSFVLFCFGYVGFKTPLILVGTKKTPLRGRQGLTEYASKISSSISQKRRWHLGFGAENMWNSRSCL